ncbi:MAG: recombinase RecA [Halobacteriota archaeon]|nr:recombinase RecA [Halobacteriota archaeon]
MEEEERELLRQANNSSLPRASNDGIQGVSVTEELVTSPIKPTGIGLLDGILGGGLPAGYVIYFSAEAESMSEVFLYQFSSSRKTYYFTTARRPKYIAQNITDMSFDVKDVIFIDVYSQYYLDKFGEMIDNVGNEFVDKEIVDFVEYQLKNIRVQEENDFNIIIDTFSFFLELNVNMGKILRLTNLIYEITKETGSLSYLYVLKDTHDDRIEKEMMNLSDAIFDVSLERAGDRVASKLTIPKIRGRMPVNDLIKFKVFGGVQIDTSRDIA